MIRFSVYYSFKRCSDTQIYNVCETKVHIYLKYHSVVFLVGCKIQLTVLPTLKQVITIPRQSGPRSDLPSAHDDPLDGGATRGPRRHGRGQAHSFLGRRSSHQVWGGDPRVSLLQGEDRLTSRPDESPLHTNGTSRVLARTIFTPRDSIACVSHDVLQALPHISTRKGQSKDESNSLSIRTKLGFTLG